MKKLIIVITIVLFCISANSQERRLALVIGNGDYPKGILANPGNDAKSMEKALKAIGFEVKRYENLKQKEMARAIDDFGNRLKNYDVGLFFYAGHGVQSKGFNYLIPVNADLVTESDVEFNCVRADRVLGKMEDAKNNINVIILDACRDNPFERSWTRTAKGRGLATMSVPVGTVIAYATSPGSTASDGFGKNGLFTSGLLTYLNEPGITAIQMFQKVTAHVQKKSNGQQLPWVSTSLTGDFFLVPGSGKPDNTLVLNNQDIIAERDDNIGSIDTERSIAILPFSNLTGNTDQDYLVKGQHDALYTELCKLGQVKPLRIVGGRTVSALSNDQMSIPQIARQVNVEFLLEASVLGFGDSVMLQVRLIQAFPEEKPIWANIYTSDIRNILKLHNNIAGQIAQKLNMGLSAENLIELPEPRQVNPESYKAYLRGMYNIAQGSPEKNKIGLEYLHEAIRIDPADPFAYAGLALGYCEIAHGPFDPGDALMKAEAAASQAYKLDTTMAEVHLALAQVYLYSTWKFEKAEEYFKRALAINPNLDWAHYHYAWALYLFGRMEEAIVEHKLAQKYDPFNPGHTAWLGALYTQDGRYEDAIQEAQKSLEIQKDFPDGYNVLGTAYLEMGRTDEAIEVHKKLVEIAPWYKGVLGTTYARSGHRDEAEKILNEMEKSEVTPYLAYELAGLYAALGKKDEAFKWLAYEPHSGYIAWYAVSPVFKPLHDDVRFKDFLKRLNLPK
jgi:TolB-like protein/Flp pilus assembly protein TadD